MIQASFADFALAEPLGVSLGALGYLAPTPIQRLSIGPQIEGRDLVGIACTGSGKTAAFGLPLIHAVAVSKRPLLPRACQALVLAPTRELAQQIVVSLRALSGGLRLRVRSVVGGASRERQIEGLAGGAHLVVATPGRLIDLMRARAIDLGTTRHLVIDEADRMLDLGFLASVRRIAADLPASRQTVMFSATMPAQVEALAGQLLRDPVRVTTVAPRRDPRPIRQRAEIVAPAAKSRRLVELAGGPEEGGIIVFCRTRKGADRIGQIVGRQGIAVAVIHGERTQKERNRALAWFRDGRAKVLVATDLVARGIDVPGVAQVINYDLPEDVDAYVHRIGRTGRAGAPGIAVTLCLPAEIGRVRRLERALGIALLPPAPRRAGS